MKYPLFSLNVFNDCLMNWQKIFWVEVEYSNARKICYFLKHIVDSNISVCFDFSTYLVSQMVMIFKPAFYRVNSRQWTST